MRNQDVSQWKVAVLGAGKHGTVHSTVYGYEQPSGIPV